MCRSSEACGCAEWAVGCKERRHGSQAVCRGGLLFQAAGVRCSGVWVSRAVCKAYMYVRQAATCREAGMSCLRHFLNLWESMMLWKMALAVLQQRRLLRVWCLCQGARREQCSYATCNSTGFAP